MGEDFRNLSIVFSLLCPAFTELIRVQDLKLQQLKEQMFGGFGVAHMRLQVEQPVPLSILVDSPINSALAISTHFNDHQQSTVIHTNETLEDGDIDFSKAEDFLQLETPIDARRDHNALKLAYSIPQCSFMSRLLRKYPINKKRLAFIQRRPQSSKTSQPGGNGFSRKGDGKDTAVSCQVCGQRFTRQHLFQQHILTHPDPDNKIFLCQICGKRFNRADHLNRHSLLHQVAVFKCQQCGEEFDRASHLDRHRRKNHPPVGQIPTQTPPHTPQGKTPGGGAFVTPHPTGSSSGSNLHLLASVATPESVSGVMSLGVTSDGVESPGIQFVNLVEPDEQVIQGALPSFSDPRPLPPSTEKPEPERPFLCNVCNHRFIRATHLRRHMRIHTGEKPFTCHICGQRYARGDYLRAHIQAHRRDRIHKCKHCGEAFHDLTRFADHCRLMHRDVNDEFGNPCPPPEYSPPPPAPSVTLESTLAFEAAEEITMIPMSEVTGQQFMPTSAPSNILSHHPISVQSVHNEATPHTHISHAPSPPDMIQMTLVNIPDPSPPSPDVIITSHVPAHSPHPSLHQYHQHHVSSPNEVVVMPTLQHHALHNGTQMGVITDRRGPDFVTMATPKPLPTLYDANDPILQYIIANGNAGTLTNGSSQPLHH